MLRGLLALPEIMFDPMLAFRLFRRTESGRSSMSTTSMVVWSSKSAILKFVAGSCSVN